MLQVPALLAVELAVMSRLRSISRSSATASWSPLLFSATVLSLALDPRKPLRDLTVRATANEVVIGLMAVTLERPN